MIDIPVRVKDALKSGAYKKEYRMVTGDGVIATNIDIAEYTVIPKTSKYYLYAGKGFHVNIHRNGEFVFTIYSSYNKTAQRYETELTELLEDDVIHGGGATWHYNLTLVDGFEINNTFLVAESVSFDEHMCSGTDLKFGLCEGSSCEFQYFDRPNILNLRFQAFINVQYTDENNELAWYEIPMGWFTADSVSRQASTGIMKVTAYNKLKSAYLDEEMPVQEFVEQGESGVPGEVSVYALLSNLLSDFSIQEQDPETRWLSTLREYWDYELINVDLADWFVQSRSGGSTSYIYVYTVKYNLKNTEYGQTINNYYWYELYCDYVYDYIANELNDYSITDEDGHSLKWHGKNDATGVAGIMRVLNTEGTVLNTCYIGNNWDELKPYSSGWVTNNVEVQFEIPIIINISNTYPDPDPPTTQELIFLMKYDRLIRSNEVIPQINEKVLNGIEGLKITSEEVKSSATLRQIQSAVFELYCQFGKLDRSTDLFSGMELNNSRLYPADDLYPAAGLYPVSAAERGNPAMYSQLWADEGNVRSFRNLNITYKTTVEEEGETKEVEATLQRVINANGTDDYNITDNWLLKTVIWTEEQVGAIADYMVSKMQSVSWFPFEMWSAGLPYLETGDEIEIAMGEEAYTSYVLQRTLSGIQNLHDTMINGTLDIF